MLQLHERSASLIKYLFGTGSTVRTKELTVEDISLPIRERYLNLFTCVLGFANLHVFVVTLVWDLQYPFVYWRIKFRPHADNFWINLYDYELYPYLNMDHNVRLIDTVDRVVQQNEVPRKKHVILNPKDPDQLRLGEDYVGTLIPEPYRPLG